LKKLKTFDPGWAHYQIGKNVFQVNAEFVRNKDWEFWALLTSDQHWDNPHSDHSLQKKHLDQALERNAVIMSAGDYFCAMQGRYDKRSNKSAVRPEHQVDNYLDSLVKTGADFLQPYARNFVLIATGNHEQAIIDRHETNLIDRLCGALNDRTASKIHNGGYSGYIIFKFKLNSAQKKPMSFSIVLRYEHGAGSSTAKIGDSFNRSAHFPDCDILLSGHNHSQWLNEIGRQRLDKNTGALKQDLQTHIKCPSYKDEFGIGQGGWGVAKMGFPPKPIGAWWLRFYYDNTSESILYEVIQAR